MFFSKDSLARRVVNVVAWRLFKEMGDSNFTDCSIVTNPFDNENIRGQMAILGPTRLPYEQIKTILTNFTQIIVNVS